MKQFLNKEKEDNLTTTPMIRLTQWLCPPRSSPQLLLWQNLDCDLKHNLKQAKVPLLVQHPLSPLQPLYRVHPLLHKTIRLIPLPLLKPLHPIHLLKPDSQSVATQPVGTTSNPEAPSSTATASNSNS